MCFCFVLVRENRFPINMPLCASTGPALGRCWQHRTSTGPVLAHVYSMFTGTYENFPVLFSRCDAKRTSKDVLKIISTDM